MPVIDTMNKAIKEGANLHFSLDKPFPKKINAIISMVFIIIGLNITMRPINKEHAPTIRIKPK